METGKKREARSFGGTPSSPARHLIGGGATQIQLLLTESN
jgi:hypothetical protein